jgi:hypothetical protein
VLDVETLPVRGSICEAFFWLLPPSRDLENGLKKAGHVSPSAISTTMQTTPAKPADDLKTVVESQIKYVFPRRLTSKGVALTRMFQRVPFPYGSSVPKQWDSCSRFNPPDIYFHQMNIEETAAALQLRDAILRLRHEGAFVAVPLAIVNSSPLGPHPVGE